MLNGGRKKNNPAGGTTTTNASVFWGIFALSCSTSRYGSTYDFIKPVPLLYTHTLHGPWCMHFSFLFLWINFNFMRFDFRISRKR